MAGESRGGPRGDGAGYQQHWLWQAKMTDEEIIRGSSCLEAYKEKLTRDYKPEVLYFSSQTKLYKLSVVGSALANWV